MKIFYDHQIFAWQSYGGVSRYFFELMNQFSQIGKPQFELSLTFSKNNYLKNGDIGNKRFFYINHKLPRKIVKIMLTINKIKSRKALSGRGFDILHPTYYDPYFLKYLKGKPFVLTIYDMISEVFNSQYANRDQTVENKKLLAKKAAKIIAISENTKKDILRFFPGIDESKVVVTYLANSLPKLDISHSDLQVPSKYILFVGGRRAFYKNFYFFIRSISPLLIEDKDLNVICVSEKPFKTSEREIFRNLRIEEQIHHISATDKTLAGLYQNALAFVFPSLYEGFGIPVLEAFACSCPAILSSTSSLPEVGGEAAVYFDPKNKDSIKDAVSNVIYNEELRDTLRTMGLKQLERFSWRKTAEKTKAIYRSIL